MFVAISAAGAFRTDDGGTTWQPINRGLRSRVHPRPGRRGRATASTASRMHPSRPDTLFMQKHWDVMRSDDAGDNWREVSGNLPTDFGFPIDVHAHEPETIYVVPIKSDSEHFPPEGKLRVYRSRTGGNEWEPLTKGLPQSDCYVNVLRDAMAVDTLDPCGDLLRHHRRPGLRARPTAATAGRRSCATCRPCSRSRSRRCHDPGRPALPPAQPGPGGRRGGARGERAADAQRPVLDALEAALPRAPRHHPRPRHGRSAAPFVRFFACEQDLSHEPPDTPLPEPVVRGVEPFLIVGATAGG